MTTLVGVESHDVDSVWESASALIESALHRGGQRFSLDDIRGALALREMQLWLAIDMAYEIKGLAITEIRNYPRRKVCAVLILTGKDAREWFHHMDGIAAWAKAEGCQSLEAWARKGWVRLYKGRMKMTHVMLEREL